MGEITEGMTRAEMEFVIYGMSLADWLAQRVLPGDIGCPGLDDF
jgi:hypothetical protein